MKVLVIGGTGFIGRRVVEELLRREHEVTIYHRGQHEVQFAAPVVHVHGDRRDYARFRADLARLSPEAVVDDIPMNAEDTRSLVEALRGRIARSVHLSSGDVYASRQSVPLSEDAALRSADPAEMRVHGQAIPYSKVAVETALREAQAAGDLPATILRLPAVYGPSDPLAREWFFLKRVLDGRPRIALPDGGASLFHRGYVEDVARAVVLALESAQAVGRTYNVGHDRVLTVRGIAELIAQQMGHRWEIISVPAAWLPPTNPYATQYPIVYELGRIRAELGYRESISSQGGMQRALASLVANQPTLENWGLYRHLSHDPFDYAAEDAAMEAADNG